MQRNWQTRLRYSYVERDEDRRRDSEGRVKSQDIDVSRTILIDGVPFEQLLERNGRSPSAEEASKERENLDKLRRETPEQRTERSLKRAEENASLVREVPKAFDFQLLDDEVVNGRAAYVIQATPRPDYRAEGKYGRILSKVEGKFWVDKQDLGWIKVDGRVIQPFSIGLLLARVLCGSHITMEQTRVGDGIWMPLRVEMRAAARVFFVKSLSIERILTYSEYKLADAGAPTAVRMDDKPPLTKPSSSIPAATMMVK